MRVKRAKALLQSLNVWMASQEDIESSGLLQSLPSSVPRLRPAIVAGSVFGVLLVLASVASLLHGQQTVARFAFINKADESGRAVGEIEQTLAIPQSAYVLECPASDKDTTKMTMIRTMGGLIAAFTLNGENVILDQPSPESGMQGSTFWPSPQSLFNGGKGWPPPPTISGGWEWDGKTGRSAEDGGMYDVKVDDANQKVTMTSKPDPTLKGLSVTKEISCDSNRKAMVIRYTMVTEELLKVAPWEKTNLPAGALIFWHHGSSEKILRTDDMNDPKTKTAKADGDTFYFDHANDDVHKNGTKISANTSTTFIAAVRKGTMFVKVFQKVPVGKAAPGEGDLAVFARPSFTSLENQGPFEEVKPKESSVFVVCWYARTLPQGAKPKKGDKMLMEAVKAVAEMGCPGK